MKKNRLKEGLFITGNLLSKATGIFTRSAVVAFLAGLVANVALDAIERKERANIKK